MFNIKQIKQGFQLLAFIIFTLQMIQAVVKYLDYPIIQENSLPQTGNISDLKPVMYACQESQFSYLKADTQIYQMFLRLMLINLFVLLELQ